MPTRGRPRTYATHAEKIRAYRQRKKARVPPQLPPLPADFYRVVYADPPWEAFGLSPRFGGKLSWQPDYTPPWDLETLCALPVVRHLEATAYLALWVPSPLLEAGLEVVTAWGFRYRRLVAWDLMQSHRGFGEKPPLLLMICTRGNMDPGNIRLSGVQRLSATPDETRPASVRHALETRDIRGRRLELFARRAVPGWDVWPSDEQAAAYQLACGKRGISLQLCAPERQGGGLLRPTLPPGAAATE